MTKNLKVALFVQTITTAMMFGLITYFIIYGGLASGNRLIAYMYNIVFIAIILILDKVADHIMQSDDFLTRDHGRWKNLLARTLFATHMVSFKTALYLFYIVMLVLSRASFLEPDLIDRYQLSFIYSVEYGVLLLIPLDKFMELLTKDDKRLLKIVSRKKVDTAQPEHHNPNSLLTKQAINDKIVASTIVISAKEEHDPDQYIDKYQVQGVPNAHSSRLVQPNTE
ncbi:MAG: hypothetical protein FWD96_04150 [Defluviitaleaceae bacterium]|nr:hypothetical protein [Defluviitaleaceae bacterium]